MRVVCTQENKGILGWKKQHTCSCTVGVLPGYQIWHYPTKSSGEYLNGIQLDVPFVVVRNIRNQFGEMNILSNLALTVITNKAESAPDKTVALGCRMAISAAIINVSSPI